MNIKRLVAFGSISVVAVLAVVGAAVAAGTYSTNFESFTADTTVNGQDGWHSAVPGDIPALPDGYDQSIVTNGGGVPAEFGTKSLRVSNAVTEATGEFEYQTYSAQTSEPAGENETNKIFYGKFEFFDAAYQQNLQVNVSPDNGHGGRMSYLSLTDTANGVQATFYDVAADGTFQGYDAGLLAHGQRHIVEFKIEFVPGDANDVLRLIIDGVDIGDKLGECFTTWEEAYPAPPVTDSLEFRVDNSQNAGGALDCNLNGAVMNGATCTVPTLTPGVSGYLFDNVETTTGTTGGPAPTTCGLAADGKILPTGTTCQLYKDGSVPALEQVLYTTKGSSINSVSPGVFFYYTKVTGDQDQTVDITQSDNGSTPAIPIQQGQTFLYDASTCLKVKWDVNINSDGTATGQLPADGSYIIGVKYNPAALQKLPAPAPTTVTYTFGTTLDNVAQQVDSTIDLAPKK